MKARHTLIGGPSGGGKTTHARKMYHYNEGPAIWVNHSRESINGTTATTESEIKSAIDRAGEGARIDYRWNGDPQHGPDIPLRVAAAYNGPATVYIDEGSAVMPEGVTREDNSTAWAFHEARDLNVQVVLITQDPVELAYPPIKNIQYLVWAGPPKTFHRGFLNFYGLDASMLPDRDHEYTVIRPTEPPEVVHKGTTDERFS